MDVEIQKILFDQEIKMINAILADYKVYADLDGYYYVKKYVGQLIQGKVLELTKDQIWIADQWEEVPIYIRKEVNVKLENGESTKVFIYEKNNIKSEIEANSNSLSNLPLEEVITEAKKLKKQLNYLK